MKHIVFMLAFFGLLAVQPAVAQNMGADMVVPGGALAMSVDEIRAGCEGGFSGGGEGYGIRGDGTVFKWQSDSFDKDKQTIVKTGRAIAEKLFDEFEQNNFMSLSYNEQGNENCFVSYHKGLGENKLTWPVGETLSVPAEGLALFKKVMALGR